MKRFIAGIVGGIVLFLWSFVCHMVLPFAEHAMKSLPNEEAVVGAMKASITEPGLYFFPGMDMSREMSKEEQAAWEAKHVAGPIGIIVYQPVGHNVMSMGQFTNELIADILAVMLAIVALGRCVTIPGLRRFLVGAAIGLVVWFSASVSYWNWYGFPGAYVVAEMLDYAVGWALALLIAGRLARPRAV